MANLSQQKRERMLAFLEMLKTQHTDDDSLIALGEIEKELKAKKYGLVWEEHEEAVDVMMQTHIPVFTADDSMEINGDSNSEQYNFLLESGKQLQLAMTGQAKTATFTLPESELYKFSFVKQIKPMAKNVYAGYTTEFVTAETRKSTPERLFEKYCEGCDAVEWVYKNGDSGQQYFSVVYLDGFSGKQWLFYPDYIVKLTNGEIWIIETKGGMNAGFTKNIDMQVENKFTAFKDYAKRYGVKWCFVRDIDEDLFICNTEYTDDMFGGNWLPLESVLK